MASGRIVAGVGTPQYLDLVNGATAPNTSPTAPAVVDIWDVTMAGVPDPGDIAHIRIGTDDYFSEVQPEVQDKWQCAVGSSPAPSPGDTATLTIPGGAGSPYTHVVTAATQKVYSKVNAIGGTPTIGDVVTLTLNGTAYSYLYESGNDKTDMLAGVCTATSSGTKDNWSFTIGATNNVGDVLRITSNGTNYDYTVQVTDTTAVILAASLKAYLAANEPWYTWTNVGNKVIAKKGAGVTKFSHLPNPLYYSTDTGSTAPVCTNNTVGNAGQSTWSCVPSGWDLTCTHVAAGATSDTVVPSYSGSTTLSLDAPTGGTDADTPATIATALASAASANGLYTATAVGPSVHLDQIAPYGAGAAVTSGITGAGSFVATHTQTGAAQTSNAALCTDIAAQITALDPDYTAAAVGSVVTVTAKVAGAPTRALSSAFDPSTGSGTFLAANTQPGSNAGIPETAGEGISGCKASTGVVHATLNAGTSFKFSVWLHDPVTNTWLQDLTLGTKTVTASGLYSWVVGGDRAYVYVHDFVGGADATVLLTTAE